MRVFKSSEGTVGFVPREGLAFVVGYGLPREAAQGDDSTCVRAFWIGPFVFAVATWGPDDPR